MARLYQQGPIPSDPTGRMVISHQKGDSVQSVHWLPGPKFEGDTWICGGCRREFVREDKQWRERVI